MYFPTFTSRDSENQKKRSDIAKFSDSCSSPHAPRALAQPPSGRVPSTWHPPRTLSTVPWARWFWSSTGARHAWCDSCARRTVCVEGDGRPQWHLRSHGDNRHGANLVEIHIQYSLCDCTILFLTYRTGWIPTYCRPICRGWLELVQRTAKFILHIYVIILACSGKMYRNCNCH